MTSITPHMTVSEIIKSKHESEDGPKKKSREDWRKAKELEEARKAGTAPAAVDEEGRDINPHIPQYISSAPWYFNAAGPTLKHQRIQPDTVKTFASLDQWYSRGVDTTKVSTRYRKGACENCGAMTHKKKDCMERPRKVGAKFSNAEIAPDEFVQPCLDRDFDGKRDRWAGYDPASHRDVVDRFAKIEEAKRQLRAEKLEAQAQNQEGGGGAEGEEGAVEEATDKEKEEKGSDEGGSEEEGGGSDGGESEEEEDDDKYADEIDMPGTKVDSKQRITVRNLRIREDTAKYLRNLDPNSAYYDPKTRSMRDNPYQNTPQQQEVDYEGENFVRFTGDTRNHAKVQMFAWEAYEKGVDVHPLGEPTKLELLSKEFQTKKHQFKKQGQQSILEKYGGEEHLDAPPRELLLAQTQHYAEYTRYGTVIKGEEKVSLRSRYEEDVLTNNHTSVWGSYWNDHRWGYKCCHSFFKGSYCTGEAGKLAQSAAQADLLQQQQQQQQQASTSSSTSMPPPPQPPPRAEPPPPTSSSSDSDSSSDSEDEAAKKKERRKKKNKKNKDQKKKNKKKKKKDKKNKKKSDDEEEEKPEKTKQDKLKEAIQKEEERLREVERLMVMDERKRPYNSMFTVEEPTDVEMEAYYFVKKRRDDDPMAHFINK